MPRGRRNRQRVLALNGVATVGLARLTHCIARTCMQAREKSLKNFGLGSIALPTRPTARRGRRCSAGHAAQLAHLVRLSWCMTAFAVVAPRQAFGQRRNAGQRVVIGSVLGCPAKRFGAFTLPHARCRWRGLGALRTWQQWQFPKRQHTSALNKGNAFMSNNQAGDERPCLHCMMMDLLEDFFAEYPTPQGEPDTIDADEVITALAKTVAELTCGQNGANRQQIIEKLMREIVDFDAEFRREDASGAIASAMRH
jgi:hypothetical protein